MGKKWTLKTLNLMTPRWRAYEIFIVLHIGVAYKIEFNILHIWFSKMFFWWLNEGLLFRICTNRKNSFFQCCGSGPRADPDPEQIRTRSKSGPGADLDPKQIRTRSRSGPWADPDPGGSALFFVCWIRIRTVSTDPDLGGPKWPTNVKKSARCFLLRDEDFCNSDVLHWGLGISNWILFQLWISSNLWLSNLRSWSGSATLHFSTILGQYSSFSR
jgi:hypothetical protein